jgi:hypothetical protein
MPNVILISRCNQSCPSCFARVQSDSRPREMSFDDLRAVLNFLEASGETAVRLMGGEPTLHREFERVINHLTERKFQIHVFTNGTFSPATADFLAEKKDLIRYSFNVNPPAFYAPDRWRKILHNLEKLSLFGNFLLGAVISGADFGVDYLLDLAARFGAQAVMLRVANPIYGAKNEYSAPGQFAGLATNFICQIKKAHERKIKIGFGCGVAKNMFSFDQLKVLRECGVGNLKWGCDANSGHFDILPDLSVIRCLPLFNWEKKQLSEFSNSRGAADYFHKEMKKIQAKYSGHNFMRRGPCFAYLLNKYFKNENR